METILKRKAVYFNTILKFYDVWSIFTKVKTYKVRKRHEKRQAYKYIAFEC